MIAIMDSYVDSIPINVTQDDLENGVRFDAYLCPLALAICRTLKLKPPSVVVQYKQLQINGFWHAMSAESKKLLRDFDSFGKTCVSPTTVTISKNGVRWFIT